MVGRSRAAAARYDAILRETEASEARSDLEARLIVKEKYDHLRESYRAKVRLDYHSNVID